MTKPRQPSRPDVHFARGRGQFPSDADLLEEYQPLAEKESGRVVAPANVSPGELLILEGQAEQRREQAELRNQNTFLLRSHRNLAMGLLVLRDELQRETHTRDEQHRKHLEEEQVERGQMMRELGKINRAVIDPNTGTAYLPAVATETLKQTPDITTTKKDTRLGALLLGLLFVVIQTLEHFNEIMKSLFPSHP